MSETTLEDRPPEDSFLDSHPLDTPAWSALTSKHRDISDGDTLARRYPVAFAPFAGIADTSPQSFALLQRLVPQRDQGGHVYAVPCYPDSWNTRLDAGENGAPIGGNLDSRRHESTSHESIGTF